MIVGVDSVPVEKRIQALCVKPYYGHSRGCPNYGRKHGCPPQPLLDGIFDFDKELYVIHTTFPVGEFAERMKQEHPQWQNHPRQWYNPRRWQPRARKEHRLELERFVTEYPSANFTTCPEAHGVNVTELMRNLGIELSWQWPPEHNTDNMTYLVSIGGYEN